MVNIDKSLVLSRSNVDIIFKELNSVFQPHETSCYAFYKQRLYLEGSNEKDVYKPCVTFDDVMQHTGDTCLIIGQNLSHPQTGLEIARSLNLETKSKYISFRNYTYML